MPEKEQHIRIDKVIRVDDSKSGDGEYHEKTRSMGEVIRKQETRIGEDGVKEHITSFVPRKRKSYSYGGQTKR